MMEFAAFVLADNHQMIGVSKELGSTLESSTSAELEIPAPQFHDVNGQYLYRYGKPGQAPELEIQSKQEDVVYTPWNGMGSAIWARLGFRNKGYFYDVGRSIQKGGESQPEGFLDIYEAGNDTPIGTKQCQTGTVQGDLDGLWNRFD